jgi:hypothetical protein
MYDIRRIVDVRSLRMTLVLFFLTPKCERQATLAFFAFKR